MRDLCLRKRGLMQRGLLVLLLPLGGCSSLLKSDAPPVQSYLLRAPALETAGTPIDASLRVARPLPSPGLDSDRIVLVQSDRRLNYFAASRWAANVPDVVETLAVETLRSSGAWKVVQDSRSALPTDYLLQITIHRFEADYTDRSGASSDAPVVHVSLNCVLSRWADRELLASFAAEASEPSTANRLAPVVEAFEVATGKALTLMAERAAVAVRTSRGPSSP
jgi:cholesterol transport system auxiliary component